MDSTSIGPSTPEQHAIANKLEHGLNPLQLLDGNRSNTRSKLPPSISIRLGGRTQPNEYRDSLQRAGFNICGTANLLLASMTVIEPVIVLGLVRVTGAALGFTRRSSFDSICDRAVTQGLDLCPAEVGPALRLNWTDQSEDELPCIAMEAITDKEGSPFVFALTRYENGSWLTVNLLRGTDTCRPDEEFVFVRKH